MPTICAPKFRSVGLMTIIGVGTNDNGGIKGDRDAGSTVGDRTATAGGGVGVRGTSVSVAVVGDGGAGVFEGGTGVVSIGVGVTKKIEIGVDVAGR